MRQTKHRRPGKLLTAPALLLALTTALSPTVGAAADIDASAAIPGFKELPVPTYPDSLPPKKSIPLDENLRLKLETYLQDAPIVIKPGGQGGSGNSGSGGNGGSDSGGGNDAHPSPPDAETLEQAVAGASEWAHEEIKQAIERGLTTIHVLGDYQEPITRKHFAGIAVKLMEALTGRKAEASGPSPFTDTDDPDVLKAYNLSVVQGVDTDKFAPDALVSRQEIGVMLYRVFHLSGQFPQGTAQIVQFADEASIADWAKDAIVYVASAGIIQGKSGGLFDPLGQATREEAIVLIRRTAASTGK